MAKDETPTKPPLTPEKIAYLQELAKDHGYELLPGDKGVRSPDSRWAIPLDEFEDYLAQIARDKKAAAAKKSAPKKAPAKEPEPSEQDTPSGGVVDTQLEANPAKKEPGNALGRPSLMEMAGIDIRRIDDPDYIKVISKAKPHDSDEYTPPAKQAAPKAAAANAEEEPVIVVKKAIPSQRPNGKKPVSDKMVGEDDDTPPEPSLGEQATEFARKNKKSLLISGGVAAGLLATVAVPFAAMRSKGKPDEKPLPNRTPVAHVQPVEQHIADMPKATLNQQDMMPQGFQPVPPAPPVQQAPQQPFAFQPPIAPPKPEVKPETKPEVKPAPPVEFLPDEPPAVQVPPALPNPLDLPPQIQQPKAPEPEKVNHVGVSETRRKKMAKWFESTANCEYAGKDLWKPKKAENHDEIAAKVREAAKAYDEGDLSGSLKLISQAKALLPKDGADKEIPSILRSFIIDQGREVKIDLLKNKIRLERNDAEKQKMEQQVNVLEALGAYRHSGLALVNDKGPMTTPMRNIDFHESNRRRELDEANLAGMVGNYIAVAESIATLKRCEDGIRLQAPKQGRYRLDSLTQEQLAERKVSDIVVKAAATAQREAEKAR